MLPRAETSGPASVELEDVLDKHLRARFDMNAQKMRKCSNLTAALKTKAQKRKRENTPWTLPYLIASQSSQANAKLVEALSELATGKFAKYMRDQGQSPPTCRMASELG